MSNGKNLYSTTQKKTVKSTPGETPQKGFDPNSLIEFNKGLQSDNLDSVNLQELGDSGVAAATTENAAAQNSFMADSQGHLAKTFNTIIGGALEGAVNATKLPISAATSLVDSLGADIDEDYWRAIPDLAKEQVGDFFKVASHESKPNESFLESALSYDMARSITSSVAEFYLLGRASSSLVKGAGHLMRGAGMNANKLGMSPEITKLMENFLNKGSKGLIEGLNPFKGSSNPILANLLTTDAIASGLASNIAEGNVMALEAKHEMERLYAPILFDESADPALKAKIQEEMDANYRAIVSTNMLNVGMDILGFSKLGGALTKKMKAPLGKLGIKNPISELGITKNIKNMASDLGAKDIGIVSIGEGLEEIAQSVMTTAYGQSTLQAIDDYNNKLPENQRYGKPKVEGFTPENSVLWNTNPEKAGEIALNNAYSTAELMMQYATNKETLLEGVAGLISGGPQWMFTRSAGALNYSKNKEDRQKHQKFTDRVTNLYHTAGVAELQNEKAFKKALDKIQKDSPDADDDVLAQVTADYAATSAVISSLQNGKHEDTFEFLHERKVQLEQELKDGVITEDEYKTLNSRLESSVDLFDKYKEVLTDDGREEILNNIFVLETAKASAQAIDETLDKVKTNLRENVAEVTDEDFKTFTDSGEVSESILNNITNKIKTGSPLSANEEAIRAGKPQEVEDLLSGSKLKEMEHVSKALHDKVANYEARVAHMRSNEGQKVLREAAEFQATLNTNRTRIAKMRNVGRINKEINRLKSLTQRSEGKTKEAYEDLLEQATTQLAVAKEMAKNKTTNKTTNEKRRSLMDIFKRREKKEATDKKESEKNAEKKTEKVDEVEEVVETEEDEDPELDSYNAYDDMDPEDLEDFGKNPADYGFVKDESGQWVKKETDDVSKSVEENDNDRDIEEYKRIQKIKNEAIELSKSQFTSDEMTKAAAIKADQMISNFIALPTADKNNPQSDALLILKSAPEVGLITSVAENVFNNYSEIASDNDSNVVSVPSGDVFLSMMSEVLSIPKKDIRGASKFMYAQFTDSMVEMVEQNDHTGTLKVQTDDVDANKKESDQQKEQARYSSASVETGGSAIAWKSDAPIDFRKIKKGTSLKYKVLSDEDIKNRFTIDKDGNKVPDPVTVLVKVKGKLTKVEWSKFVEARENANNPEYVAKAKESGEWENNPLLSALVRTRPDAFWNYSDVNIRPIDVIATRGPAKGQTIGYVRSTMWAEHDRYHPDGNRVSDNILRKNWESLNERRRRITHRYEKGGTFAGKITDRKANIQVTPEGLFKGTAIARDSRDPALTGKRLGGDSELVYAILQKDDAGKVKLDDEYKKVINDKHSVRVKKGGKEKVVKPQIVVPPYLKPGSVVVFIPLEDSGIYVAQALNFTKVKPEYVSYISNTLNSLTEGKHKTGPTGTARKFNGIIPTQHEYDPTVQEPQWKMNMDFIPTTNGSRNKGSGTMTVAMTIGDTQKIITYDVKKHRDGLFSYEVKKVHEQTPTGIRPVKGNVDTLAKRLFDEFRASDQESLPYFNIDRVKLLNSQRKDKNGEDHFINNVKSMGGGKAYNTNVDYIKDVLHQNTRTSIAKPQVIGDSFTYNTNTIITTELSSGTQYDTEIQKIIDKEEVEYNELILKELAEKKKQSDKQAEASAKIADGIELAESNRRAVIENLEDHVTQLDKIGELIIEKEASDNEEEIEALEDAIFDIYDEYPSLATTIEDKLDDMDLYEANLGLISALKDAKEIEIKEIGSIEINEDNYPEFMDMDISKSTEESGKLSARERAALRKKKRAEAKGDTQTPKKEPKLTKGSFNWYVDQLMKRTDTRFTTPLRQAVDSKHLLYNEEGNFFVYKREKYDNTDALLDELQQDVERFYRKSGISVTHIKGRSSYEYFLAGGKENQLKGLIEDTKAELFKTQGLLVEAQAEGDVNYMALHTLHVRNLETKIADIEGVIANGSTDTIDLSKVFVKQDLSETNALLNKSLSDYRKKDVLVNGEFALTRAEEMAAKDGIFGKFVAAISAQKMDHIAKANVLNNHFIETSVASFKSDINRTKREAQALYADYVKKDKVDSPKAEKVKNFIDFLDFMEKTYDFTAIAKEAQSEALIKLGYIVKESEENADDELEQLEASTRVSWDTLASMTKDPTKGVTARLKAKMLNLPLYTTYRNVVIQDVTLFGSPVIDKNAYVKVMDTLSDYTEHTWDEKKKAIDRMAADFNSNPNRYVSFGFAAELAPMMNKFRYKEKMEFNRVMSKRKNNFKGINKTKDGAVVEKNFQFATMARKELGQYRGKIKNIAGEEASNEFKAILQGGQKRPSSYGALDLVNFSTVHLAVKDIDTFLSEYPLEQDRIDLFESLPIDDIAKVNSALLKLKHQLLTNPDSQNMRMLMSVPVPEGGFKGLSMLVDKGPHVELGKDGLKIVQNIDRIVNPSVDTVVSSAVSAFATAGLDVDSTVFSSLREAALNQERVPKVDFNFNEVGDDEGLDIYSALSGYLKNTSKLLDKTTSEYKKSTLKTESLAMINWLYTNAGVSTSSAMVQLGSLKVTAYSDPNLQSTVFKDFSEGRTQDIENCSFANKMSVMQVLKQTKLKPFSDYSEGGLKPTWDTNEKGALTDKQELLFKTLSYLVSKDFSYNGISSFRSEDSDSKIFLGGTEYNLNLTTARMAMSTKSDKQKLDMINGLSFNNVLNDEGRVSDDVLDFMTDSLVGPSLNLMLLNSQGTIEGDYKKGAFDIIYDLESINEDREFFESFAKLDFNAEIESIFDPVHKTNITKNKSLSVAQKNEKLEALEYVQETARDHTAMKIANDKDNQISMLIDMGVFGVNAAGQMYLKEEQLTGKRKKEVNYTAFDQLKGAPKILSREEKVDMAVALGKFLAATKGEKLEGSRFKKAVTESMLFESSTKESQARIDDISRGLDANTFDKKAAFEQMGLYLNEDQLSKVLDTPYYKMLTKERTKTLDPKAIYNKYKVAIDDHFDSETYEEAIEDAGRLGLVTYLATASDILSEDEKADHEKALAEAETPEDENKTEIDYTQSYKEINILGFQSFSTNENSYITDHYKAIVKDSSSSAGLDKDGNMLIDDKILNEVFTTKAIDEAYNLTMESMLLNGPLGDYYKPGKENVIEEVNPDTGKNEKVTLIPGDEGFNYTKAIKATKDNLGKRSASNVTPKTAMQGNNKVRVIVSEEDEFDSYHKGYEGKSFKEIEYGDAGSLWTVESEVVFNVQEGSLDPKHIKPTIQFLKGEITEKEFKAKTQLKPSSIAWVVKPVISGFTETDIDTAGGTLGSLRRKVYDKTGLSSISRNLVGSSDDLKHNNKGLRKLEALEAEEAAANEGLDIEKDYAQWTLVMMSPPTALKIFRPTNTFKSDRGENSLSTVKGSIIETNTKYFGRQQETKTKENKQGKDSGQANDAIMANVTPDMKIKGFDKPVREEYASILAAERANSLKLLGRLLQTNDLSDATKSIQGEFIDQEQEQELISNIDDLNNIVVSDESLSIIVKASLEAQGKGLRQENILIDKWLELNDKGEFKYDIAQYSDFKTFLDRIRSAVDANSLKKKRAVSQLALVPSTYINLNDKSTGITFMKGFVPHESGQLLPPIAGENGEPSQKGQALLPFDFNYFDTEQGSFVQGTMDQFLDEEGFFDTDKVPMELLEHLGFRTPTQGASMTVPIEVVGFLPQGRNNGIMVAPELVPLMGHDFDIDKMFMLKYAKIKTADGKYRKINESDVEQYPDLEKHYINNRKLDLLNGVLSDPDYMTNYVIQSLDRENDMFEIADTIEKLTVEKRYEYGDYNDPMTQLKKNMQAREASAGIAIMAKSLRVFAQIKYAGIPVMGKIDKVFQEKPIHIGDRTISTIGQDGVLFKTLDELGDNATDEEKKDAYFYSVGNNLNVLASLAVDNENLQLLTRLGMGEKTFNKVMSMAMHGLDIKSISYIMKNPAVNYKQLEAIKESIKSKGGKVDSSLETFEFFMGEKKSATEFKHFTERMLEVGVNFTQGKLENIPVSQLNNLLKLHTLVSSMEYSYKQTLAPFSTLFNRDSKGNYHTMGEVTGMINKFKDPKYAPVMEKLEKIPEVSNAIAYTNVMHTTFRKIAENNEHLSKVEALLGGALQKVNSYDVLKEVQSIVYAHLKPNIFSLGYRLNTVKQTLHDDHKETKVRNPFLRGISVDLEGSVKTVSLFKDAGIPTTDYYNAFEDIAHMGVINGVDMALVHQDLIAHALSDNNNSFGNSYKFLIDPKYYSNTGTDRVDYKKVAAIVAYNQELTEKDLEGTPFTPTTDEDGNRYVEYLQDTYRIGDDGKSVQHVVKVGEDSRYVNRSRVSQLLELTEDQSTIDVDKAINRIFTSGKDAAFKELYIAIGEPFELVTTEDKSSSYDPGFGKRKITLSTQGNLRATLKHEMLHSLTDSMSIAYNRGLLSKRLAGYNPEVVSEIGRTLKSLDDGRKQLGESLVESVELSLQNPNNTALNYDRYLAGGFYKHILTSGAIKSKMLSYALENDEIRARALKSLGMQDKGSDINEYSVKDSEAGIYMDSAIQNAFIYTMFLDALNGKGPLKLDLTKKYEEDTDTDFMSLTLVTDTGERIEGYRMTPDYLETLKSMHNTAVNMAGESKVVSDVANVMKDRANGDQEVTDELDWAGTLNYAASSLQEFLASSSQLATGYQYDKGESYIPEYKSAYKSIPDKIAKLFSDAFKKISAMIDMLLGNSTTDIEKDVAYLASLNKIDNFTNGKPDPIVGWIDEEYLSDILDKCK